MSLIRYERSPFFSDLQREINRLFDASAGRDDNGLGSDWTPAVDIHEEDDAYVVRADLPGVHPDDIEVTCHNGVLTVQGHRSSIIGDDKPGYHRVERVQGRFVRRFTLPDSVDSEAIEGRAEHGVLEVRIPKAQKAQPKRIEIKG